MPETKKTYIEKRKYPRLDKSIPVKIYTEEPETNSAYAVLWEAVCKNISEGGILIEENKKKLIYLIRPGQKKYNLSILLELPGCRDLSRIQSRIVWIEEETPTVDKIRIGLEFQNLPTEARSAISSYLIEQNRLQKELYSLPECIETFPIKVESSVIVKRPKEEVYNYLKHMEQFPKFMEYVKQVDILEGRSNRIITEWEVYFDGTTFTWKEEDIFDDEKMAIRFKMIEGDFGRYEGEWQLFSLLTGTEILLSVIVDWGIPNWEKHVEKALEKKMELFLKEMLNAIKKKVWTERIQKLVKFACLIHPLDIDLINTFDMKVQKKRESTVKKMLQWTPPYRCSYITGVRSLKGKEIDGELIMCPLLPDQILSLDNNVVLQKVIEAGKIAEERGAKIFGLAAYTANVGRKGILVANALNIPVTTGTSYTIATAIEATLKAAEEIGIELQQAKAVIIGATGAIGSICSQVLADKVASLTLVARNKERLEDFANLVCKSSTALIKTSGIIDKFLFRNTDIIITATNTPSALINVDFLPPGVIVCDMSLPRNISEEAANSRGDLLVIDGGVVKPPGDVNFNFYFGLPPGLCYACIAEPMILALEERFECYSIGGHITLDKVREISQLALKHGFKIAKLRSFGKELKEDKLEAVRKMI